MEIDLLIRDLDSLGVRDEIQDFHFTSCAYGYRNPEEEEEALAMFPREVEYTSALKFNSIYKDKIIASSIILHIKNKENLFGNYTSPASHKRVSYIEIFFTKEKKVLKLFVKNNKPNLVYYKKGRRTAEVLLDESQLLYSKRSVIEIVTKAAQTNWNIFTPVVCM